MQWKRSWKAVCAVLVAGALAGCGAGVQLKPALNSTSTVGGRLMGGQQPVSGAAVQLYAVGTAGAGSASRPLLVAPATSDANGNWSITGRYTCPADDPLVYVVARGGNPGLASGQTNANLALMTVLSNCSSLTASTFIMVNEVTTVAATFSLPGYMTGYANVGGTQQQPELTAAFSTARQLANTATGMSPGTGLATNTFAPVTTVYTLADVVAACVNSPGGVAGDGSACGTLFSAAVNNGQAPTDTVGALLNSALHPDQNVAAEFGLVTPGAPFQPVLGAAPSRWDVSLSVLQSLSIFALQDSVQSGSTLNLTAFGNFNNASSVNVTGQVAWSSSNSGIATVNAAGQVAGVSAGSVTITASSGNIQASTTLTITKRLLYLTIAPNPVSIPVSGSVYLRVTGYYDDNSTAAVNAYLGVADSNILVVNNGIATGVAPGKTTVTATLNGVSVTAPVTVFPQSTQPYPTLTAFRVDSCTYNPIIFSTCRFSFTAVNLTAGAVYDVSAETVCYPECVRFRFTATSDTYTVQSAAPTFYDGQFDNYGNPTPEPHIAGNLANGYANLSGQQGEAFLTVYSDAFPGAGYRVGRVYYKFP